MRTARTAGTRHAASATSRITTATTMNVAASCEEMP